LRAREFGGRYKWPPHAVAVTRHSSLDWFRTEAIGSRYLLSRMECMWKLRGHDGCVNCLGFNPSGRLV
jgi:hypothetical protein